MSFYSENQMQQKEGLVGQHMPQQLREAEKILSEFSSSLSNYASLLDQLTDRVTVLCVPQTENPQKITNVPQPLMSPIGIELSSRIAGFDELNQRLEQLLRSLTF